jgi:hypothetical protein
MGTVFRPEGPLAIRPCEGLGGKIINGDSADRFWGEHAHLADGIGCYVFGRRAGKGIVPWYVGKATRSFRQECFESKKLNKYSEALILQRIGTPVMFFVVKVEGPTACINDLENFLIQNAVVKNPSLLNEIRKEWRINGVLRSEPGPPSHSARHLRRLLGIEA